MRRFGPGAAVLLATGVDVGGLLVLRVGAGWSVAGADAVALTVAAPVSYVLHRLTDRGADPFVRWVRDPRRFAVVAVIAAIADLAVLQILVLAVDEPSGSTVLAAKVVAVAVAALVRVAGHRRIFGRAVRAEQAAPALRPPPPGDRRLTVVLPAYRQAEAAAAAVGRVRQAIGATVGPSDLEIVVVDDGSGDDTA